MDEELVRDGRVARLETRGHRTGESRSVSVGYVDGPDGSIIVAAHADEASWARNLDADPEAIVTVGDRIFTAVAERLDTTDPRRHAAVRDLILRYGTPSEGLGRGPVFVLRPTGDA
jgi:deazaflavin-dependent oxidoreductase (nitroreductase family)